VRHRLKGYIAEANVLQRRNRRCRQEGFRALVVREEGQEHFRQHLCVYPGSRLNASLTHRSRWYHALRRDRRGHHQGYQGAAIDHSPYRPVAGHQGGRGQKVRIRASSVGQLANVLLFTG
jgi:hypothetical protein